jgi:hypothetical protein
VRATSSGQESGRFCVGKLSGDGLSVKWCPAARMLLNEIVRANESSRRPARGNETDWPAWDQYWAAAVSRNWNREYSRPRAMRDQLRIKSEGRPQKNKTGNEDPEQRLWLAAGKESPDSGRENRDEQDLAHERQEPENQPASRKSIED